MNKRNLAAVLWFFAGWSGGGLLTVFGLPAVAALAPGLVLAGIVLWDPVGWFSPRRPTNKRVVRPINEVAEELDRKSERWSGAEAEQRHV